MKFKLGRRSYIFGIIFGICIGIGIGYMISSAQVIQQIVRSNDGEVIVAIAALKKMEFTLIVCGEYIDPQLGPIDRSESCGTALHNGRSHTADFPT